MHPAGCSIPDGRKDHSSKERKSGDGKAQNWRDYPTAAKQRGSVLDSNKAEKLELGNGRHYDSTWHNAQQSDQHEISTGMVVGLVGLNITRFCLSLRSRCSRCACIRLTRHGGPGSHSIMLNRVRIVPLPVWRHAAWSGVAPEPGELDIPSIVAIIKLNDAGILPVQIR